MTDPGSVMITGAAGFVGSHTARRFVDAGRPIVGIDVRNPNPALYPNQADFVKMDLTDESALLGLVAGAGTAGIIHAAAVVGPTAAGTDVQQTLRINVSGTGVVLEVCRKLGLRVTYISTATIYGASQRALCREGDLPQPVGIYDATKLMGEILLGVYVKNGVVGSALRPSFVYGPGSSVGDYFLPEVVRGEAVRRESGADHPCEFTYVADLAEAVFLAHTVRPLRSHIFNVSSGEMRTRGELAHIVRQLVPGASIDIGPGLDPERHLRPSMDLSLVREQLGYRPRHSLEKGMREWMSWIALQNT